MKRLIFILLLTLTAGCFISCQKGEKFYHGTWSVALKAYNSHNDLVTVKHTFDISKDMKVTYKFLNAENQEEIQTGDCQLENDNTLIVVIRNPLHIAVDRFIFQKANSDLFWPSRSLLLYREK